ncbi:hypothetical protein FF38_06212, partial [Lucilia cuprina]
SGLLDKGNESRLLSELKAAGNELSQLLRLAYDARILADYEPEIKTMKNDGVICLKAHKLTTASQWPKQAEKQCAKLKRIWKEIDNLQAKLKQEYNINSDLVLLDSEDLIKMSKGFEVLLKTTFPESIDKAEVYFLNAQKVSVTLKISDTIESTQKRTIETFLKTVLNSANIEIQVVHWDQIELPSLIEILVTIKKLQPVKLEQTYVNLLEEYSSLHKSWLNKQLDKLIKKRFLVREQSTETYALTAQGLSVLPKIANRNSSDIVRALDLGRKKW